jgi:hypothetical protein
MATQITACLGFGRARAASLDSIDGSFTKAHQRVAMLLLVPAAAHAPLLLQPWPKHLSQPDYRWGLTLH